MPDSRFRVALTADFYDAEGRLKYPDIGLDLMRSEPHVEVTQFAVHGPEISADQLAGMNGAIVLTPRVTAASLKNSADLLALGRFGVGYDSVDVAACTAADVLLYITAGAVDHSVAEATVGWMLALTHQMRAKDKLVREARWNDRAGYMGTELRSRTLGIVGFGGIGKAVLRMLSGFGMQRALVYDPFVSAKSITDAGARPVTLDELLSAADFVSLHCPLNDKTRNLIGEKELARMKPGAWLINTARGGIVNEPALFDALKARKIAGAAIDCFETEPLVAPPKLAELENVLFAPHCIAWTDELFRDIGRAACQGMLDLAHGRPPKGLINPEVLNSPTFKAKWKRNLRSS